ncbi:MlrC C-terminal domain-containing protein [Reyranella sp.]|uniref:MlrC C-terminal domain-containing protein n=1 Tax=Reyranella sp. TaxID=1929291 RepID=UPI003BA87EDE
MRICFDAGLGARLDLRVGGKIAPSSGQPLDAEVEVIGLERNARQTFGPSSIPVGDCAAARVGGVDFVLTTNRTQATGLELFTNLGIDPRQKKIVVVKSTSHFLATYGPIAKKVVYVESGGPLRNDYRRMPYAKAERPIWPLDADAAAARG